MYMKHFLLTLLAFLSFASFQAKRLTVNIELKNYETFLPTGTSVSDLHVYVKVADDRKGEAHITLDEMGKGSATFTRFSGGNVYCEVECPNAEMLYTTEDIYEADAGTITKVVDFAKEFHRIKFHLAGMSPAIGIAHLVSVSGEMPKTTRRNHYNSILIFTMTNLKRMSQIAQSTLCALVG